MYAEGERSITIDHKTTPLYLAAKKDDDKCRQWLDAEMKIYLQDGQRRCLTDSALVENAWRGLYETMPRQKKADRRAGAGLICRLEGRYQVLVR